jgi:nitronate monooxygenase
VQTRLYDLIGERPFPAENPDRVLRNAFIDRWRGREAEIPAHRKELQTEVDAGQADPTVAGVSAGVVAGLIGSARPAGEIVREIVLEAETLLRERPRMLLG